MVSRRAPGEPGRHMPAGGSTCSYDGGDSDSPICGAPAAWHLFAGSPDTGPGEFSMTACDAHANLAMRFAWDWHPFGGVCDMPGTLWMPGAMQGEGFCYWPEAEAAAHEELARDPRAAGAVVSGRV